MFLQRYSRDRDPADLATARGLLRWVDDQAVAEPGGALRWPVAAGDDSSATGFELGVAGVAWVHLQAARQTGDEASRAAARAAGRWLRAARTPGGVWAESGGDSGSPIHVGLDSGAAGIGWVLEDLARAGIEPAANGKASRAALAAVHDGASRDRSGTYWYESHAGKRRRFRAEPSWHWGAAGIAAFASRLAGWSCRGPGGQPTRAGE